MVVSTLLLMVEVLHKGQFTTSLFNYLYVLYCSILILVISKKIILVIVVHKDVPYSFTLHLD